jgi:hypothetical protein
VGGGLILSVGGLADREACGERETGLSAAIELGLIHGNELETDERRSS